MVAADGGRDRRAGACGRRDPGLLPAGAGGGDAGRLLPRQPDPRRGLAAVHGARRAVDRDRHAGLGPLGPPEPGPLRLLDVRALGLPRALPRRARGRPAQAGRPRLGLAGADRRPAAPGAGREARRSINVVPLLPGYRWHWVAQIWRRRGLGELANATTTKSLDGADHAPALGRPPPDAPRVHRDDLAPHGQGHPRGHPRPLPPRRPRSPRRCRQGPRTASPAPPWSSGATSDPYLRPRSPRPTPEALPSSELEIVPAAPATGPGSTTPRVIDDVLELRRLAPPLTGELQLPSRCLVPSPASDRKLAPGLGRRSAASSASWSSSTSPTSWSAASPTASAPTRSPTASR